jgi:DNA polymerase
MKKIAPEGPTDASIMIIGEAPGREEMKQHRVFVGRSGKLLNALLEKITLPRKKIFITNLFLTPLPSPLSYKKYQNAQNELFQTLSCMKPKLVICLGHLATKAVLNYAQYPFNSMKNLHGHKLFLKNTKASFYVIPLYHPAWALWGKKRQKIFFDDLIKHQKLIKRFL